MNDFTLRELARQHQDDLVHEIEHDERAAEFRRLRAEVEREVGRDVLIAERWGRRHLPHLRPHHLVIHGHRL